MWRGLAVNTPERAIRSIAVSRAWGTPLLPPVRQLRASKQNNWTIETQRRYSFNDGHRGTVNGDGGDEGEGEA